MSGKSGLEMIEELLVRFATQERRMEVIEQNMKLLLAVKNVSAPSGLPPGLKLNNKPVGGGARLETPESIPPKEKPLVTAAANSRVIGRIEGTDGKVLTGLNVRIYDDRNAKVKDTKTNRAGDWMAFLPPGRYVAEYMKDDQMNENVVFNVNPDDQIVRVAQPKV